MAQASDAPKVRPAGLVTVAFLKAQLDTGIDHLGIFLPLVLDVLPDSPGARFTTVIIQEAIAARHGVAMPQQVVATLLKRAVNKGYVSREPGCYTRTAAGCPGAASPLLAQKSLIEKNQRCLGEALQSHARQRGLVVNSPDDALDMLFRFLEAEQVALLLQDGSENGVPPDEDRMEQVVVAEFIQNVVVGSPALAETLRGMLEGLVVYNGAFLPDLSAVTRRFADLRIAFDSNLVRQTLGYEGDAMRILMRETLDVLKGSGIHCFVFDKTVQEIRRILSMYEAKLATAEGRSSLKPVPMARHFVTQRYSPSDVREMSALLEIEIRAAGFNIRQVPAHVIEYTRCEKSLAQRFADRETHDELEPRVVHDVDCVAGVLTLRKGHRASSLEDTRVLFATISPLVIRNSRRWWFEDERETGIAPVVHIRAVSNLAWLKRPSLSKDFKLREMVAFCATALRPEQTTWDRFLRHLRSLEQSKRITSDEMTAIVVSAMSDRLLAEAEFEQDDPDDIDVTTLDEVVDRVIATYTANANERVRSIEGSYEARLLEMHRQLGEVTEDARRYTLVIEGRANAWAKCVSRCVRWGAAALLVAGALSLIVGHPFHSGWIGAMIGIAVVFFVFLELVGILRHVSEWGDRLESALRRRFRNWLGAGFAAGRQTATDTSARDVIEDSACGHADAGAGDGAP